MEFKLFEELMNKKVKTKKSHPCGNDIWTVVRVGADFKLKCEKCSRVVMLSYEDFKKRVVKILED